MKKSKKESPLYWGKVTISLEFSSKKGCFFVMVILIFPYEKVFERFDYR